MKNRGPEGKFMASVKVGPKGQIVIPKEVREMFGIEPGDTMLLLADADRGIALEQYNVLSQLVDRIISAKGEVIQDDEGEES